MGDKLVRLHEDTYARLKALGRYGDSMDDIIKKLLGNDKKGNEAKWKKTN